MQKDHQLPPGLLANQIPPNPMVEIVVGFHVSRSPSRSRIRQFACGVLSSSTVTPLSTKLRIGMAIFFRCRATFRLPGGEQGKLSLQLLHHRNPYVLTEAMGGFPRQPLTIL